MESGELTNTELPNPVEIVRNFQRNINNLQLRIDPLKLDPVVEHIDDVATANYEAYNTNICGMTEETEVKHDIDRSEKDEISETKENGEYFTGISREIDISSITTTQERDNEPTYQTSVMGDNGVVRNGNKMITYDNQRLRSEKKSCTCRIKRKWFVLLAGFVMIFISIGLPFQLSVLYVQLLEEFGSSNAETALVQSVCTGVFFGGGFISGLVVTRFGVRIACSIGGVIAAVGLTSSFFAMNIPYLVVTVGLVSGFGFSLIYVCSSTGVGQHFHGKSKVLALSFLSFASGVGSMLFPYITESLIRMFSWRGTLLVIGGMTLNVIPAGLLCVPPLDQLEKEKLKKVRNSSVWDSKQNKQGPDINQSAKGDNQNDERNNSSFKKEKESQRPNDKEMLKGLRTVLNNKLFLLYVLGLSMALSALNALLIFIFDFYKSRGLDRSTAVFVLFLCNTVSAFSRLIPGLLKQIPHISVLIIPAIYAALGCVAFQLFTMVNTYEHLVLVSCLYGVSLGGIVTTISVATVKLVGVEHYSTGLGVLLSTGSIGGISAGPVSGKLLDISGSYDLSLYTACGALGCATVIFIITAILRKRIRKEEATLEMEIIVNRRMSRRRSSILPWKRTLEFVY